jgi:ubiquinone/menaquinone biosynthesis C-methylase UbiE
MTDQAKFKYSWEQAIEILREDPEHRELIADAYLTRDLVDNCLRFAASEEFLEIRQLLRKYAPHARTVLDMPGGNGIATHAFAQAGYQVTTVEPNPSDSVGRGAIAHVLAHARLDVELVDAWGESLPFASDRFDVAYVRQGLHHAQSLPMMLLQLARVLKPGGVLIACREHVVDDYEGSLRAFLANQVDHQLYGGEHAFTLQDYRAAIDASGLERTVEFGPFDSIVNAYPNTPERLRRKILESRPGRLLATVLPDTVVEAIGRWHVKRRKAPGRLYTFIAVKPASF